MGMKKAGNPCSYWIFRPDLQRVKHEFGGAAGIEPVTIDSFSVLDFGLLTSGPTSGNTPNNTPSVSGSS
jgi:hypothetical protein